MIFRKKRIDKIIVVGIIIILLVFLYFWITYYPWETDVKNSISLTKNSDINEILEGMSLEEKIFQMFIVSPEQITGVEIVTAAGNTTKQAISTYPVGGIIYSSSNAISKEQISEVISNTQSFSRIKLFICVDEEGGIGNQIMGTLEMNKVDLMYSYKDRGTKVARKNACTIAKDIKTLGVNVNFAPVADVWSNPYNTVVGRRAYSDDFKQASKLVRAAVRGYHDGGVLCTLKHFPGCGDTAEEIHTSTAYVMKNKNKLEKEELLPFLAGIEGGADFVMVGHMIVDDIDNTVPASLSPVIVEGMLRDELGFNGLIITDILKMQAISGRYSSGEAAVKAVNAGCDILLEPENLSEAIEAITESVRTGVISESRINQSVLRVLQAKSKVGAI